MDPEKAEIATAESTTSRTELNVPSEQQSSETPPPIGVREANIFYHIRQVRSESTNSIDFTRRLTSLICGSIFFTIIWALSSIIPIAMIVIGAINTRNCHVEPNIPLWLIVSGTFGCLSSLMTTFGRLYEYSRGAGRERLNTVRILFNIRSIIDFFLAAWLIVGTLWVYNIYYKVNIYNPASFYYCDKTTYLFAFAVITASWILMVLTCLCFACCLPMYLMLDYMQYR